MKLERFSIPRHVSREQVLEFILGIQSELSSQEHTSQRRFFIDVKLTKGVELFISDINRDPRHNSLTIKTFGIHTQADEELTKPYFENIREKIAKFIFDNAV